MRKICGTIFTIVVLCSMLVLSGCGSDGKSRMKSIMKDQAEITEDYVDGLSSAKDADDVVEAIEKYTSGMKALIPEMKEVYEKYPEYRQGKVPEGLEKEAARLEEISAKLPGAMMKTASYMMDQQVREAMSRMGEAMEKLQ